MKDISAMLKKKSKSGFSLLELAIFMVIVGLVTATTLQTYKIYTSGKALNITKGRLFEIESALTQFLTKNGRLPCPAVPSEGPTALTSGMEISTCGSDPTEGAVGSCTAGGYCQSPGRDANSNATPDLVLSGYVPYITLGLAMKSSLDGWDKKIKYVVTAKLTQSATYNAGYGAISVQAANGANTLSSAAGTGQVVLMSHGEDGRGAYTLGGALYAACPASASSGRDFENCNEPLNATYYDRNARSFVSGPDHYDDYVHYKYMIVSSTDRWTHSSATTMQNSGGRRVGIGTPTPTNHLHVAGNIKASGLRANNYCNYGINPPAAVVGTAGKPGINCLPPSLFGGIGSSCAVGSMNGIKDAAAQCAISIAPGSIATGTCGTGTVMCGVDGAGGIICHVPGATTCP